ncbi:MAG TPA: NAD-dependent epimerase/dehydratase family protein [Pyrinomonadaceae bacterium]|nr:NAD-dependent epimerase/dehydratase family protein [Pyrinomonadaceae bacterium]
MKILVTGALGFIGKHLVEALKRREGLDVFAMDRSWSDVQLDDALKGVHFIFHIAGVNRPPTSDEFAKGNAGFTEEICRKLVRLGRNPTMVLTSSIQAELDNPYGQSKKAAEHAVAAYSKETGAPAAIFRLKNVFGKWCRPNYNSVTATFCHNIAHDLPIQISDESRELALVYIDDVVAALVSVFEKPPQPGQVEWRNVDKSHEITLGELARRIRSFRQSRQTLFVPDFADEFSRKLYATYLSYLPPSEFAYVLDKKTDQRGVLAEFVKSPPFGQIFVSRTKPGITRGNHYHHTKTEKFMVVEGEAIIRFRNINGSDVVEYPVTGKDFKVVDIPPGYTHSIENVGDGEMVTLFWACEIFDPTRADTYFVNVK